MKKSCMGLIWVCIVLISPFAFAQSSVSLNRETLVEILESPQASSELELEKIEARVRSYRLTPVPGTLSIQDSPFVGYVLQNEVLPEYASLESSEYPAQYAANVTDLNLEGLFDLFMGQVIQGGLTGDIKKMGDEIGPCMAKKIEEAKDEKTSQGELSCPALDSSDKIPKKPSTLTLGLMKYTCSMGVYRPCAIRKAVYASAKKELIAFSKQWPETFQQEWPSLFRGSLTSGFNTDRAQIGQLVSTKFTGTFDEQVWNAPLADLSDVTTDTETLHDFAMGMRADIRAASLLSQSSSNSTKGLAGALFYAAANRLLILMGGTQLKWDGSKFVPVAPNVGGDAFDAKNPTAAPKYLTDVFGGITAMLSQSAGATQQITAPLDIMNYAPSTSVSPTPLQLFPTSFILGANDVPSLAVAADGKPVPAVETLGDLADLMSGLMDFLDLSQASSPLASHFATGADGASVDQIIDPKQPALFPREGRQLAAGLIAAIFGNVLSAQGHLQMPPSDGSDPTGGPADPDHDGVFGVKFYDQIGLGGRLCGKVPTDSLARLFTAAARFSSLIGLNDPDIPSQLVNIRSQIDLAVQIGLLSIIADAQDADGGVDTDLGTHLSTNRTLSTLVDTLRALTIGYQAARSAPLRQALHAEWAYLDGYWKQLGASGYPLAYEPGSVLGASEADSATLWSLVNLWNETKSSFIYADLMDPSMDLGWAKTQGWDKWETRFEALQKELAI
jgi:hypothetical protein